MGKSTTGSRAAGAHSDRFSFVFALILTLIFLCYGILVMKQNAFSLSKIISYDSDAMTLTIGDNEYTAAPPVREAVGAILNKAEETTNTLLPIPLQKSAKECLEGILYAAQQIYGGLDSAFALFVRGNM